jgi:hypothetical protein
MADEIVIPLKLWLHRVNNANASYDQLTQTTNNHMPDGIRLKDAETTDINFCLAYPVPSDINGTPAATIDLKWATASSDTSSNVKFFVRCLDITYNTTSMDPAAWDDSLTVLDASNGAYVENSCYVSLSSTAVTSGLQIRGIIRREATDAQDTLAADVIITQAFLVADKA